MGVVLPHDQRLRAPPQYSLSGQDTEAGKSNWRRFIGPDCI